MDSTEKNEKLPSANSLPDGFVDESPPSVSTLTSPPSVSTLTSPPSVSTLTSPPLIVNTDNNNNNSNSIKEISVIKDKDDYKDELLVQVGSRPDIVFQDDYNNKNQHSSSSLKVKAMEGVIEAQPKKISPTENAGSSKNKETTEVKRKTTKRISEKEFLEFTLKYQHVIKERDAAVTMRDKLESLCRELQRQNKNLMDECKRVSMEGQNLRLDISSRFHDAIQEVSNKLEEQKGECLSQLKENEMLRTNLKQFADQYALSEKQHAHKLKEKTLELQLADLKIQQYEEKLLQEQSQMKLYAEQVSQLLTTEKNLRLQLTSDGAKFQQFQDALVKSNEVFESFKEEIEKMTKSIKELRKENTSLKSKCQQTDVTLIQLIDERENLKKQLEKTKNQKEKLESLCRSLQEERKQTTQVSVTD